MGRKRRCSSSKGVISTFCNLGVPFSDMHQRKLKVPIFNEIKRLVFLRDYKTLNQVIVPEKYSILVLMSN